METDLGALPSGLFGSQVQKPTLEEVQAVADDTIPNVDLEATLSIAEFHVAFDPRLSQYNLAINLKHSFLFCSWCYCVVNPQNFSRHLLKSHEVAISKGEIHRINQYLAFLKENNSIDVQLPVVPEEVVEPWGGLMVFDGFHCRECSFFSTSVKSHQNHHRQKHFGPTPKSFPECKIQRLGRRKWFRVDLSLLSFVGATQVSKDEFYQPIFDYLEADLISHEASDYREVTPWLHRMKWHLHTGPHPTAELMDLVVFPRNDNMLCNVVDYYFRQATKCLKNTDELILQKLNTDDPAKT